MGKNRGNKKINRKWSLFRRDRGKGFGPVVRKCGDAGATASAEQSDETQSQIPPPLDRNSTDPVGDIRVGSGTPCPKPEDVAYEERRATTGGPQLFCVLIDNSISMEEGNKATEASRVLADFMAYASQQNGLDGTGRKTYIYTQAVMFAENFDDITDGMAKPPARLKPDERWTVRHSSCADRLGNTTDFQKALDHVFQTLSGPDGMTADRLKAAMPAPVVLLITDGKPTRPWPESHAREAAREAASRIKGLILPQAKRPHPTAEELDYAPTSVKLVTIGLGTGEELDSGFLDELASTGEWQDASFPLYLHCPDVAQLRMLGSQIVGTMVKADQRAGRRLEEVIAGLRHLG